MTAYSSLINRKWIFGHSALLHHLAGRVKQPGKLVFTAFGQDPSRVNPESGKPGLGLTPKVFHVDIGDHALMAERVGEVADLAHYNAYMPLAIFRADLAAGKKGSEEDVVACLGLVADFDDADAARWADRLPLPPQYVLETSSGRFQAFYLFKEPVQLKQAKPVAERLKAYAGCDHGTSDISHVWRVAGSLNWPNAKKVSEGRAAEPQLVTIVQPFVGKTIAFEKLAAALPESGAAPRTQKPSAAKSTHARKGQPHPAAVEYTVEWWLAFNAVLLLPDELKEELKRPYQQGERSTALFRVIKKLIERGKDDAEIENIIHAHPKGIGQKYVDRDDLDKEIARIRQKMTDPISRLVDEMNEQYAVVDDTGKTCVVYRSKDEELNR
jgi:hypothetical protein